MPGKLPWISIHGTESKTIKTGEALASRGLIVRSWKAVLGGKTSSTPYASFFATEWGKENFRTTIELSPPSDVVELKPGDFLDTEIEVVVYPADARAYYGPNEPFRRALDKDADTSRLVWREASGNSLNVEEKNGKVERTFPLRVKANRQGQAACVVTGGIGYVPVTFTGLVDYRDFELVVEGQALDQGLHGNDFWQTDFDEIRREWSVTYNILRDGKGPARLELRKYKGGR
jgi:hypothetical protein